MPAKLKGVIDIGSNSVRLMIYAVRGLSITPHYNEKIMAGLGRGLIETGRLNPEGVDTAIDALRRFRIIAEGLGDVPIDAFATAAVRTASDGATFVERAKIETGFEISVLSGLDEAQASARGVLAGLRDVNGVIGDLGGSSLELISAGDGSLGNGETHLLGPLALLGEGEFNKDRVRQQVRASLKASSVLETDQGRFYAVGGSFRAFARLNMELSGYPIRLLHGYTMDAKDVISLADRLSDGDAEVSDKSRSVSSKRAGLLPYAAEVLREIFRAGQFSDLQVSAFGLREGRLFLQSEGVDARQTLLDGLETVGRLLPSQRPFAQALHQFVSPVFENLAPVFEKAETDALLREGACRLADIGATLHPEYRADLSYRLVRDGPFGGVDHAERLFLAYTTARRYSKSFKPLGRDSDVMHEDMAKRAKQLGGVLRLGAVLSGRTPDALLDAKLRLVEGKLVLSPGALGQDMISEFVLRRFQQAASQFDVEAVVEV